MSWYRNILVVVSVAIFYTCVPDYINHIADPTSDRAGSAPKLWVIGFCLLSLPVLIRQVLRSDILRSPLMIWCFGFALITITWFFLSSQSDMTWQEVRWRFLTIVELFMFLALFAEPNTTRLVRQALVVAVIFGAVINIYELFVPLSFSEVNGRSAGLYMNPNRTGAALIVGMIFSATVLPTRFRGPFILFTGIAIFATLSRSAILMWVIAVMGFMFLGKVSPKNLFLSVSVSLLVVVLVLLPRWDQFLTNLGSLGVINKDIEERLDWLADPTGVSDDSSWERKYLAKQAWDKIADRPFLGSGTGSSREMAIGAHNQYLMFMQDHGLLGAAILPLLLLAVTWGVRGEARGVAIVYGGTIIVWSFFSHNVVNQVETLMLFALMAAMSLTSRESEMAKSIDVDARATRASALQSTPRPFRSSP